MEHSENKPLGWGWLDQFMETSDRRSALLSPCFVLLPDLKFQGFRCALKKLRNTAIRVIPLFDSFAAIHKVTEKGNRVLWFRPSSKRQIRRETKSSPAEQRPAGTDA